MSFYTHGLRRFATKVRGGHVHHKFKTWVPLVADKEVPVVLKQNHEGLGRIGQIVYVARGNLRHNLGPRGIAAVANWENIDLYAKPDDSSAVSESGESITMKHQRSRQHAYDFLHELELHFSRSADISNPSYLADPVTKMDIIETLSAELGVDLLPDQLEIPQNSLQSTNAQEIYHQIPHNPRVGEEIFTSGLHNVLATFSWKSGEVTQYRIGVRIESEEELRQLEAIQAELAKKQYKKPEFKTYEVPAPTEAAAEQAAEPTLTHDEIIRKVDRLANTLASLDPDAQTAAPTMSTHDIEGAQALNRKAQNMSLKKKMANQLNKEKYQQKLADEAQARKDQSNADKAKNEKKPRNLKKDEENVSKPE